MKRIMKIQSELRQGMSLPKCRKCGCMKETLANLQSHLSALKNDGSPDLLKNIERWVKRIGPIKYACLGCKHCFPTVAVNIFNQVFTNATQVQSLGHDFEIREQGWPPAPGEYFAFCDGSACPVAISTLASAELAECLAHNRPRELCLVGKTETENIGIDKVIKNTITNPTIRVLLLAGKESKGHYSGKTLFALWKKGVDENMRVIDSPGRRPVLRNVTRDEVEAFQRQVIVVDMIGCEDVATIFQTVKELSKNVRPFSLDTLQWAKCMETVRMTAVPKIEAKRPAKVGMDKAGYFVVIPDRENRIIRAEHYSNDNSLLRIIEGNDARSIYGTIIANGWVSLLSHAAYLGKELAKAEFLIRFGVKYVQDSA